MPCQVLAYLVQCSFSSSCSAYPPHLVFLSDSVASAYFTLDILETVKFFIIVMPVDLAINLQKGVESPTCVMYNASGIGRTAYVDQGV